MIINPVDIKQYYKCGRAIMEYLVYECLIPPIGMDEKHDFFYFDKTDNLKQCLKKMPLNLKFLALFINNDLENS